MEFEYPKANQYTIYSKSGCPNCLKAKDLLKENKLIFNVINCDEYLLEDKQGFLEHIKCISNGVQCNVFPIIFYNNLLVGGYKDLQQNIKEKEFSLNEDF